MIDWERALLSIPIFLLALTVHEFAHGYAAYKLGDKTAFRAGRLTFNPIKHIDPFGALVFVLSNFTFGWAKPVPVNVHNIADAKKGMLITAAAGPASNIVQAFVFGMLIRFGNIPVYVLASPETDLETILGKFIWFGLFVNCALAFFNLLPVPPLDGSKIMYGLLPRGKEHIVYNLERYGPIALIFLIGFGFLTGTSIIWAIIGPFVNTVIFIFTGQNLF
ncbi:MAG: site-2 protease family protein [candidate division Zixibacteria bacterium]|nr:site-2 protease family protein [candidate division Zixibacteria bacterium]